MLSALFEPAYYGIMVRNFDAIVHSAAQWEPIVGAEYVVDSDVETAAMIGDAWAEAACGVAVREVLGNDVVGVGERPVVEVAANDDALAAIFPDIAGNGLGLWGAFDACLVEFLEDSARFFFGFFLMQFACNDVLEFGFVSMVDAC